MRLRTRTLYSFPRAHGGTRALSILIAVIAVAAILQPWGLRWDFANFYDTGRRVLAGEAENLYQSRSAIAGEAPLGVMMFWGTPLSAYLYAPLALLPPVHAMRLFKLLNVLAIAAAMWILVRAYLRPIATTRTPADHVLVLGICLLFQPFWTVLVVGGQTTPFVLLLLVLFLVVYVRGAVAPAAALLTAVLFVKPAFAVMLVPFALAGQLWLVAGTALVGGIATVASIAVLGWEVHVSFIQHVIGNLGFERPWLYNSSLAAFFRNFDLVRPPSAILGALVDAGATLSKIAAVGAVAVLLHRARRAELEPHARRNLAASTAILFFPLVSEIVWEHYLMVLIVPALYVLARRSCFSVQAVGLTVAALVLCAGQNIVVPLALDRLFEIDSFAELLIVGLYKSGPAILMLLLVARHGTELIESHRNLPQGVPLHELLPLRPRAVPAAMPVAPVGGERRA